MKTNITKITNFDWTITSNQNRTYTVKDNRSGKFYILNKDKETMTAFQENNFPVFLTRVALISRNNRNVELIVIDKIKDLLKVLNKALH